MKHPDELFFKKIKINNSGIIEKLNGYHDLLYEFNQKVNLVSRKDVEFIWEHHIYPSLIGEFLCPLPRGAKVLDFGSGAGLPGLILNIARPDLSLLLVDSIGKKIRFLEFAISKLGLESARALHHRLTSNDPINELLAQIDVVTVRAVSELEKMFLDCHKMLKPNGFFLTWKGETDIPDLLALESKYNLAVDVLRPDHSLFDYSRRIKSLLLFKISVSK